MTSAAKTLNRLFAKQPMFQQALAGAPGRENKPTMVSCRLFGASFRRKVPTPLMIRQARPIFRMRPRFWRNPRALRLKYRERKKQRRACFARLRTEAKFLHVLSDHSDQSGEGYRHSSSSFARRAGCARQRSLARAKANRMLVSPG